MGKETYVVAKPEVAQATGKAINDLQKKGAQPADLAFCLAFLSFDLALQTAPSPANAVMLVTSALSHAAKATAPRKSRSKRDSRPCRMRRPSQPMRPSLAMARGPFIEARIVNRSRKVREVYEELSRALGDQVGAGELLACASQIVDIAEDDERSTDCDRGAGRVPFEEQSLDVLFERWGWKLVSQEYCPEDDEMPCANRERFIDQLFADAA